MTTASRIIYAFSNHLITLRVTGVDELNHHVDMFCLLDLKYNAQFSLRDAEYLARGHMFCTVNTNGQFYEEICW